MTADALPVPVDASRWPWHRSVAAERRWMVALGLLAVWAWVMQAGKDLGWDVLNHHLYLPFSLWTGRYQTDLFAAGTQAYQNPLGYLPFYLLWLTGLPAWALGTLLALGHGLCVWPLHRLASLVWTRPDERFWRALAVLAGMIAPVYLLVVGTTSIDPWGALAVLWALVLVLEPQRGARGALAAGALLGAAVAIKPSSLTLAPALGAIGLLQCIVGSRRWHDAGAFIVGTLLGLVVVAGHWSWWLYQTFGSPTFPLFNNLFRSPFGPVGATVAVRFLPESPADWLWRLMELAEMRAFVSTEYFTPDLRPLVAALALAAGAAVVLARGARPAGWLARARELGQRADVQCALFMVLGYLAWMASSANARYAIALFLALGVVMVRAVQVALPLRIARPALGLVLALQMLYYGLDGSHRISSEPWSGREYFAAQVPEPLVTQPYLHVTVEIQTLAALALKLHPEGAMLNLMGQLAMPTEGPLAAALTQRLDRWEGRTRFLFRDLGDEGKPGRVERAHQRLDHLFAPYGLRVDWSDCLRIGLGTGLLSCRAIRFVPQRRVLTDDDRRANDAFERIEAQCPRVMGPRPMTTEYAVDAWHRRYTNSDVWVRISKSEGVTMGYFRSLQGVYLGTLDDVLGGRSPNPCTLWKRISTP